jgi:hypothetical protein
LEGRGIRHENMKLMRDMNLSSSCSCCPPQECQNPPP